MVKNISFFVGLIFFCIEVVSAQITEAPSLDACRRILSGELMRNARSPNARKYDTAYEKAHELLAEREDRIREAGVTNIHHMPGFQEFGFRTKVAAVLVHGFGQIPFSVDRYASLFSRHGMNVVTTLLSGHGTRPDDLHRVTTADWRRDVDESINIASHMGDHVVVAGFSLGGLLAFDAVHRRSDVASSFAYALPLEPAPRFKHMIERRLGKLDNWMAAEQPNLDQDVSLWPHSFHRHIWLEPQREPVQNTFLEGQLAYSRNSLFAYKEWLKLAAEVKSHRNAGENRPLYMTLSPEDELVHFNDVSDWARSRNVSLLVIPHGRGADHFAMSEPGFLRPGRNTIFGPAEIQGLYDQIQDAQRRLGIADPYRPPVR